MTVILSIVAVVGIIMFVLTELMDWLGRLDYLRSNYPRAAKLVENRAVRTVLLFMVAALVARDLYAREVLLTAKRQADEMRAGLIPFAEEGQKMIPDCLTLPQPTIDEWASKVLAFLKNKGDGGRVVRFTDESDVRPFLPDAAMKGYTAEQFAKCSHFNARLVRLNQFLTEVR